MDIAVARTIVRSVATATQAVTVTTGHMIMMATIARHIATSADRPIGTTINNIATIGDIATNGVTNDRSAVSTAAMIATRLVV